MIILYKYVIIILLLTKFKFKKNAYLDDAFAYVMTSDEVISKHF